MATNTNKNKFASTNSDTTTNTSTVPTYTSTAVAPTFQKSQATVDAYNQLQQYNNTQPTYTSQYQSAIDDLMNKITNRESFSYDFNADPLYQQYKDQYTTQGKIAANNAAAAASTLTGGYANSYATTAAAQANQSYLTQLNNVIPELYEAALDKYNTETENLYNQFDMYGDAEDRAYNQYETELDQWNNNRNYYYNMYNDSLDNDYQDYSNQYQAYRDQVSDDQWKYDNDYTAYRDAVSDAYQTSRDAVSDAQWQKEYDFNYKQWLASQNDTSSTGSSGSGSSSKKSSSGSSDTSDYSSVLSYVNGNHSKLQIASVVTKAKNAGTITSDQADYLLAKAGISQNATGSNGTNSNKTSTSSTATGSNGSKTGSSGTTKLSDYNEALNYVTSGNHTKTQITSMLQAAYRDNKISKTQMNTLLKKAGIGSSSTGSNGK